LKGPETCQAHKLHERREGRGGGEREETTTPSSKRGLRELIAFLFRSRLLSLARSLARRAAVENSHASILHFADYQFNDGGRRVVSYSPRALINIQSRSAPAWPDLTDYIREVD
jgi:hypothetical protein